MGHKLHATIGKSTVIAQLADRWMGLANVVDLPQGFAMVPFTAWFFDNIQDMCRKPKANPYSGFERLSAKWMKVLEEVSHFGPLGYIETQYFGGVGTQAAIGWERGKVIYGPAHSDTKWNDDGTQSDSATDRAINGLLAVLGVWTKPPNDAFAMLVLDRYRNTETAAEKK